MFQLQNFHSLFGGGRAKISYAASVVAILGKAICTYSLCFKTYGSTLLIIFRALSNSIYLIYLSNHLPMESWWLVNWWNHFGKQLFINQWSWIFIYLISTILLVYIFLKLSHKTSIAVLLTENLKTIQMLINRRVHE